MEEKNKIEEKRFYPLFVSEQGLTVEQTIEENRRVWSDFDNLPKEKKDILLSYELPEKITFFEKKFALTPEATYKMTLLIRESFLGRIDESLAQEKMNEIIGNQEGGENILSELAGLQVTQEEKKDDEEILEETSVEEGVPSTVKIAILSALASYPNLGNQIISQERIRIKSQPDLVRGSLYNWIKYYRDELGIGQHSTVERGQFLFRSENGRKLLPEEREHMNLVLKSVEENLPLEIDIEKQMIVFPLLYTEKITAPAQENQSQFERTDVAKKEEVSIVGHQENNIETSFVVASQEEVNTIASLSGERQAFFVPRKAPQKPPQTFETNIAEKFQPSVSPYEKISIPHTPLTGDSSGLGVDVTHAAEKLKREPKPEWIKGAFTKETIPETTKAAPVAGAMTFSFNHLLPAEQEKPKPETGTAPVELPDLPIIESPAAVILPPPEEVSEEIVPIPKKAVPPKNSQFHIRPVSRGGF